MFRGARAYLKTASKHIKTTKEIGRKLLVEAALVLLGADDKLMQREAVVLSSHDVGRDIAEWDRILVKAMMMYSFLKEEESPSPLFKSLRYLISKAILANPEGAAAAAVVFCETNNGRHEIPEHMVKQLETWAAKYTQEGRALKWHQILKALGLPDSCKHRLSWQTKKMRSYFYHGIQSKRHASKVETKRRQTSRPCRQTRNRQPCHSNEKIKLKTHEEEN